MLTWTTTSVEFFTEILSHVIRDLSDWPSVPTFNLDVAHAFANNRPPRTAQHTHVIKTVNCKVKMVATVIDAAALMRLGNSDHCEIRIRPSDFALESMEIHREACPGELRTPICDRPEMIQHEIFDHGQYLRLARFSSFFAFSSSVAGPRLL